MSIAGGGAAEGRQGREVEAAGQDLGHVENPIKFNEYVEGETAKLLDNRAK